MVELKKNVNNNCRSIWGKPVLLLIMLSLIVLITGVAVADNGDHMDGDGMMDMDWLGFSFMWFWIIGYMIVFLIIGIIVYKDAEERGMSGLLWFILVILPFIGILFLIIYLVIRQDRTEKAIPQKSANAILDERYARGEITQEEYMRMKKELHV
jgi:putative membrane protein